MTSCQYAEPYAGGCGLALSLLFNNIVDEIYINDIDRSIASLWLCIMEHTEELSNRIRLAKLTIEEWEQQKSIQNHKDIADPLDLAFSTLYLNRTNRSGIIKAGVIGGYNQEGKYKMDCRFQKDSLINKIHQIASKKSRIHIYNLDGIDFINKLEELGLAKTIFNG
ncbi:DNA adenine methylase [Suttonella ornithocola]|uniref:site-specific DNA-methyltransferase (adenine-specific) n=1 Tax=Suttonella ornithocola TaxID=279832 RepID=A0A380RAQ6_9GAMM|nr:DNA adenine methylase [Suttonella ornithocola]SUQ09767.1 Site-specific DNA methylase [Suttonella ornithocola]